MTARGSAISLIVNQRAVGLGTSPLVNELIATLERHGLRPEPILIEKGLDPRDAARGALGRGAKTLVAAGGDGTISAVASTLLDSEAILGVLPMATLNHFAKDLQIPLDIEDAAYLLANGAGAKIDVGEVNGRAFINNSSLGIYPQMLAWRENIRPVLLHQVGAALTIFAVVPIMIVAAVPIVIALFAMMVRQPSPLRAQLWRQPSTTRRA